MEKDTYLESLGPLRAKLRTIAERCDGKDYLTLHEAANKLDDLQDLLYALKKKRETLSQINQVLNRLEKEKV